MHYFISSTAWKIRQEFDEFRKLQLYLEDCPRSPAIAGYGAINHGQAISLTAKVGSIAVGNAWLIGSNVGKTIMNHPFGNAKHTIYF